MKNSKRKELYDKVVKYNLQDTIKNNTGKNYTNLGNDAIEAEIDKFLKGFKPKDKTPKSETETKPATTTKVAEDDMNKLDKLIKVLTDKRILLKSEINYINGL